MNKNVLTNMNLSSIRNGFQQLITYNQNKEYEKAIMTYYEISGYLDALIFNYILDINIAHKIRRRALKIAHR